MLSATAQPSVGVNVGAPAFYSGDVLFADAALTECPWGSVNSPGNKSAKLDANGWPTQDAGTVFELATGTDLGGTYALSFTGQATRIKVVSSSATVKNVAYNTATNTTTASIVVAKGSGLELSFIGTRRLPSGPTNTGITNVHLMRPIAPESSVSYAPGTLFTNAALRFFEKFSTLRFMDFMKTNSNPDINWSDRTLPSQDQFSTNGGAWEFAVALANATGDDLWINIPEMASSDYITKLAQLIRYGSDGVNPYISPQANPVYAPLNPNLHVYVEYSNEVWNRNFLQFQQNNAATGAEVAVGGSPLNFDGTTDPIVLDTRRTAQRIMQTSEIFRGVFGDSLMMTQVRPVFEFQYQNLNNTAKSGLDFLNNYYNNADGIAHVADPQPVSYYLWGAGGGWYNSLNNVSGASNISLPNTSVRGTQRISRSVNLPGGFADLIFNYARGSTNEPFAIYVNGKMIGHWTAGAAGGFARTVAFSTTRGANVVQIVGTGSGSANITGIYVDTVAAMYASGLQNNTATITTEAGWAAAYGLQMTSYEGGFEVGGDIANDLQKQANFAPQARQAEINTINQFFAAGGQLGMIYYSSGYSAYGLTTDITNFAEPKVAGVTNAVASGLPPVSAGVLLPTNPGDTAVGVEDNNYLYPNHGNGSVLLLRAPVAGTYTVTFHGVQNDPNALSHLMLDGTMLPGYMTFPPASGPAGDSTALSFTITTPGLHGLSLFNDGPDQIYLDGGNATFSMASASPPPAPPTAGPTSPVASPLSAGMMQVSWTDGTGATGYRIERSSDGNVFQIVGAVLDPTSTFTDATVVPGISYVYRIQAYTLGGLSSYSSVSTPVTATAVPAGPVPFTDMDVSSPGNAAPYIPVVPGVPGFSTYDPTSDTWVVAGSGISSPLNSDYDQFHFAGYAASGLTTLQADVVSLSDNNPTAAGGLAVRASAASGTAAAEVLVSSQGVSFVVRSASGMPVTVVGSAAISGPSWIRLFNTGSSCSAFYSTDGTIWTQLGTAQPMTLGATPLVGMIVTSESPLVRNAVQFQGLSITAGM